MDDNNLAKGAACAGVPEKIHGQKLDTDRLTGLSGRYGFEVAANQAVSRAAAEGCRGYAVLLDIDDFRMVNNGYGHDYGDKLIKAFAEYLEDVFAPPDMVFRFDGDGFMVLMGHADAAALEEKLEGLAARTLKPWSIMDMDFFVTFSAGIAAYPEDVENAGALAKHAEMAMYRAKEKGKNRHEFFHGGMKEPAKKRLLMEGLLRRSMENGFAGFELYYQPVIDTEKGVVAGAEALLRIKDGSDIVMPADFLPLADQLELIVPIGEHVMRTAARQCGKINGMGFRDFRMTVNLSPRQLAQKDLVEKLVKVVAAEGIDPRNMIVSIRENVIGGDTSGIAALAEEVKKEDIGVVIDDFGRSYDALQYIKDVPVDMVKTSVGFMEKLHDGYSTEFLELIVRLCRDEGRELCVNGVENRKHYKFCVDAGVDYMQGFYMYVPGDAECLERLL